MSEITAHGEKKLVLAAGRAHPELAKEIAKANITVNALALGFVETDMTAVLNEEYRAKALAQIPLGRIGKPENMADVAMFLLSEKANYITGQVIQVDGGLAI